MTLPEDVKKNGQGWGFRHVQVAMLGLAVMFNSCMKVNMSLALVAMTDTQQNGTFDWSATAKSTILSSFKWGYIVTLVPAGQLAAKFGGMPVLSVCMIVNTIATLLLPFAAKRGGWQYASACRVLLGLGQGLMAPSAFNICGKWVPLAEKSRMTSIMFSGSHFGDAVQFVLTGYIVQYWGWPAIFYINAALGGAWVAVYLFVGASSPQTSRLISIEERMYIQQSLKHTGEEKKLKTPWRELFTSMPFLAQIVVTCGEVWCYYTLMTELPSYLQNVLSVDIKKNGLMTALPYLTCYLMAFPLGFTSDYILNKKLLSVTTCRKLSQSFADIVSAISLIILALVPPSEVIAVVLLCFAVGAHSGFYTGSNMVNLDMAPNYAGVMTGIVHFSGSCLSLFAPYAAMAVVHDATNPKDWRGVFFYTAATYIACDLFYLMFGTSKKQQWNEPAIEITGQASTKTRHRT